MRHSQFLKSPVWPPSKGKRPEKETQEIQNNFQGWPSEGVSRRVHMKFNSSQSRVAPQIDMAE
jgi:hypothetical protein